MILNAQTWISIRNQAQLAIKRRPDFSFIQTSQFQSAFTDGSSIFAGCIVGLLFWSAFQTTPVVPPYALIASFSPEKTEAAVSVPVSEKTETQSHQDEPVKTEDKEKDTHAPESQNINHAPAKIELPLAGLTEHNDKYGDLPIIRVTDKLRPFDAYRQTFPADNLDKPLVAVVMLDYGLSTKDSSSVLGVLPNGINLVLSTAASNTKNWAQQAYDHGHEVWLELAVEPEDYPLSDPGAHALLTSASIEQNQSALMSQLGAAVGYAGIFAVEPSPYFTSGADADFVSGGVFARGLGLIVNSAHADPVIKNAAIETKTPFYIGNMITATDPDQYQDNFKQAEATAKEKGFSIILFHPLPKTQKAILDWVGNLKAAGFALAPLSVLAERGADLSE